MKYYGDMQLLAVMPNSEVWFWYGGVMIWKDKYKELPRKSNELKRSQIIKFIKKENKINFNWTLIFYQPSHCDSMLADEIQEEEKNKRKII